MDLMPFDELNRLEAALPEYMNRENKSKADLDSLLDMLEDLFLLSYANGVGVRKPDARFRYIR